jgi:hypothetical protein
LSYRRYRPDDGRPAVNTGATRSGEGAGEAGLIPGAPVRRTPEPPIGDRALCVTANADVCALCLSVARTSPLAHVNAPTALVVSAKISTMACGGAKLGRIVRTVIVDLSRSWRRF